MGRQEPAPLGPLSDRAATLGVRALVAGTILGLFAFVTNPVPDPSFPWATLTEALRLPVTQPRIEHWPVTYTLAIWTWVFALPFVLLAAYRRFAPRFRFGARTWLVGLPAVLMVALTTYCRFFWPKLYPPSWNAPSYTFVCWGYCSSYVPAWSNLAYVVAALGIAAFVLAASGRASGRRLAAVFGVLSLPLGIPALVYARRA
jgi:hypothetical protein